MKGLFLFLQFLFLDQTRVCRLFPVLDTNSGTDGLSRHVGLTPHGEEDTRTRVLLSHEHPVVPTPFWPSQTKGRFTESVGEGTRIAGRVPPKSDWTLGERMSTRRVHLGLGCPGRKTSSPDDKLTPGTQTGPRSGAVPGVPTVVVEGQSDTQDPTPGPLNPAESYGPFLSLHFLYSVEPPDTGRVHPKGKPRRPCRRTRRGTPETTRTTDPMGGVGAKSDS